MLGTENIKKLVKFAIEFSEQVQSAAADGWQWTDAIGFFDEVAAIPGVVRAWPEVKAELVDLTAEEREELHSYFAAEFDIPNDKVEKFVEDGLMMVVSMISLVQQWKDLKNPPAEVQPES